MPGKPKLTYFDMGGRAEAIRQAFFLGDVEFEDERWAKEQFMSKKDSLPVGQLPVLEVDGQVLTQSNVILVYASKRAGLQPKDEWKKYRVYEILSVLEEITSTLSRSVHMEDANQKAQERKRISEVVLPKLYGGLERILEANKKTGATKFCVGDSITVADLQLAQSLNWIQAGVLDGLPVDCVDKYKRCIEVQNNVYADDKMKKYYQQVKPEQLPKKLRS